MLPVSKNTSFARFGYIVQGRPFWDCIQSLIGHINIIKRLQARDVMNAMSLQSSDLVLDVGCGAGFFSIEFSKHARCVVGIDVVENLALLSIPDFLKDKLFFANASGAKLPFLDSTFDKVLLSEILPMFSNPKDLLEEIGRVLKPEGSVVVCNGAGHPAISNFLNRAPSFFSFLLSTFAVRNYPKNYKDYCRALQSNFGTAQNDFFSATQVLNMLESVGMQAEELIYSPKKFSGQFISWLQFLVFIFGLQKLLRYLFPIVYPLLSFLEIFQRERYRGGVICVAKFC